MTAKKRFTTSNQIYFLPFFSSWQPHKKLKGPAFYGYGESLVDYQNPNNRIEVGVMLTDCCNAKLQNTGILYWEEETMKPSRITLYTVISLIAVIISYAILVREPPPDWPTNLVHLLARH